MRCVLIGSNTDRIFKHENGALWSNQLLFLAAFAASCPDKVDYEPLSQFVPLDYIPAFVQQLGSPRAGLDQLLNLCLGELSEESAEVRQTIKEAFGTELHPRLIPTFFQYLQR